ncbi:MAG: alpha/beta hydrolase [Proteobacteria bacterium]|nr:alpha/beta hydrolase [Pseudomonadota bacterium]
MARKNRPNLPSDNVIVTDWRQSPQATRLRTDPDPSSIDWPFGDDVAEVFEMLDDRHFKAYCTAVWRLIEREARRRPAATRERFLRTQRAAWMATERSARVNGADAPAPGPSPARGRAVLSKDADAMDLLLLPGMDGTGELFAPLLEAWPGPRPPTVVSYPRDTPLEYEALLPLVLASLPTDRPFILLGESYSGPLALRVAATRPPGLRGLVLVATFATCPLPGLLWLSRLARTWMFRLTPGPLLRWVLLGQVRTSRLTELLHRAVRSVSPAVMASRARQIGQVDVRPSLADCDVPVLYLSGTRDLLVWRRSRAQLARHLADLEHTALPAPHLVLQAEPVRSAERIVEFMSRCRRG